MACSQWSQLVQLNNQFPLLYTCRDQSKPFQFPLKVFLLCRSASILQLICRLYNHRSDNFLNHLIFSSDLEIGNFDLVGLLFAHLFFQRSNTFQDKLPYRHELPFHLCKEGCHYF